MDSDIYFFPYEVVAFNWRFFLIFITFDFLKCSSFMIDQFSNDSTFFFNLFAGGNAHG